MDLRNLLLRERRGGEWEGGKGNEKGENERGRKRGTPKCWFTPRVRNPEKYPNYRTDLIGGGGNTDDCPE